MVTVDIGTDRQIAENGEQSPDRSGIECIRISGSPEQIRREIIAAVLDPVEDDAIWVYRRTFETVAHGRDLSANMRVDYVSL